MRGRIKNSASSYSILLFRHTIYDMRPSSLCSRLPTRLRGGGHTTGKAFFVDATEPSDKLEPLHPNGKPMLQFQTLYLQTTPCINQHTNLPSGLRSTAWHKEGSCHAAVSGEGSGNVHRYLYKVGGTCYCSRMERDRPGANDEGG